MGLSVFAISRPKRVACRGDECDAAHSPVGVAYKRRVGLRPGCYVPGPGGRDPGFGLPYSSYDLWRRELCLFALGVPPEEVWEHPRRYQGKPFVELIDFPDCGIYSLGAVTAAKLHADFVTFAFRARKYFLIPKILETVPKGNRRSKCVTGEIEDCSWMWDVYRGFRRAFKVASDGGAVTFC